VTVGAPRHERDWEQFTLLEGDTFGTTPDATARYVAAVRAGAIARFAVDGDRVVAGALAFPCAQLVGGRPVPAGAVASVCVAPEHRGRGLGRSVMWSLVAAMSDAGLRLAPLWPSSTAFYRGMGWEVAGRIGRYDVAASELRLAAQGGDAERDPDPADVRALRSRVCREWCGPIERPDWWWRWRRPDPAPDLTYRYGWVEGGDLTGAVEFRKDAPRDRRWGYDLVVTEFLAETGSAMSGLAGLLASEEPQSPTVRFEYGALPEGNPLGLRLAGTGLVTSGTNAWMTRVLDPAGALRDAGWPDGVSARVELEVAAVGRPPSRLVLAVDDGEATVAEGGGSGEVRVAAGAFAAWYSGTLRAVEAARQGWAAGSAAALETLDGLTAGRRPWLPDIY
jgi:predicted acetyltransferase